MKKLIFLACMLMIGIVNGQSYSGKGDVKVHGGASLQKDGTGVNASFYYGIADNFSVGVQGVYVLGFPEGAKPKFKDRIDGRLMLNVNIGNVLNIDEGLHVYPGVNLGTKNFGGHLGTRYMFTEGFGLFSELVVPISKYNKNSKNYLNNQLSVNLGVTLDI